MYTILSSCHVPLYNILFLSSSLPLGKGFLAVLNVSFLALPHPLVAPHHRADVAPPLQAVATAVVIARLHCSILRRCRDPDKAQTS